MIYNFQKKLKEFLIFTVYQAKKIYANCNTKLLTEIKNFEEVKYCIDQFKKDRNKVESELVSLTQEFRDYLLNVYKIKSSLENKMCNVCSA